MSESYNLGIEGEKTAAQFLVDNNYTILKRNWHYHHKEVDIIAEKNGMLIFVEVKTRKTNYFGEPFESVTQQKQEFLIEAANGYLVDNDLDKEVRFDVISIVLSNKNSPEIFHIPDAFGPEI